MGYVKKRETCSRKHDEKKSWTHEGPSIQKKKKSWTLEGPSIQREREREIEIAHVQRKRNKGERWFMKGVHTPSTQN